jgi:hypothetical protein
MDNQGATTRNLELLAVLAEKVCAPVSGRAASTQS